MSPRILIIGATSGIAESLAQQWAAQGARLFLVARNRPRLDILAADLEVRGASVACRDIDLVHTSCHERLIADAVAWLHGVDIAVIAHGILGNQEVCEQEYTAAKEVFQVNLLSVVSLLTPLANYMERTRQGTIVVLSSVAGDRGRQSNYYYGASKGALNIFLQGLRNRLARAGVKVITIKPGYVNTQMTAHLKKHILFAEPSRVAEGIISAIQKNRREVYLPWFWRWIMLSVKLMPDWVLNTLT